MNQINYQALAHALMETQDRYKAAATPPTGIHAHGPGGLFSGAGLSRPLFSALPLPMPGLQTLLAALPTIDTNPLYGIITGQTDSSGDEPTDQCGDPPTAGTLKLCTQSLPLGLQSRQTPPYDLRDFGKRTNRGEFMDFDVYGNPNGLPPTAPTAPGRDPAAVARNDVQKLLAELGVAWARDFARDIYTGNPQNNTSGRKYFNGLDTLINTGRQDAETGVACPRADSRVLSFGNDVVGSNAAKAVQYITAIYREAQQKAMQFNLTPVRWVLTMPFGLFYSLTEVWPCAYMTYRCQTSNDTAVNIDANEQMRMRDGMRGDLYSYTGQYLLIDGQQVPVIIDDAIDWTLNAGEYRSSLYLVPISVKGGTRVTYMEHYDYNSSGGAMDAARVFAPERQFYTSDGGRFIWGTKPPSNFCVQMLVSASPRLILLTPQVAARITNIAWTNDADIGEVIWDPTDPSFTNGGQTGFPSPSYYAPTG